MTQDPREHCKNCRGRAQNCPGGLVPDCPYAQGTGGERLTAPPLSDTLRIIQVLAPPPPEDATADALALARLLRRAGHEVLALAPPGSACFRNAEKTGLSLRPFPGAAVCVLAFPYVFWSAGRLLREFRPHIVHCHSERPRRFWGLLKTAGYPFALAFQQAAETTAASTALRGKNRYERTMFLYRSLLQP